MRLRSLSTATIRRELARREAGASRIATRRDKLARKLAALDAALADLGMNGAPRRGRPPGRKPGRRGPGRPKGSKNKRRVKRAKNKMSLLDAIVSGVRKGATVSPAQAAVAARKVGYKSNSPHFGMMVANALGKSPMFKRLGRGKYVLKGSAAKGGKRGRAAKRKRREAGRRAEPKGNRMTVASAPQPAAT